ncbi:MAG TPA: hypothetical protein VNF91_07660 [Candidatus Acidoferrum sp.]|nr:hypothetical protein [Candidatus Acidoferrum sp.]
MLQSSPQPGLADVVVKMRESLASLLDRMARLIGAIPEGELYPRNSSLSLVHRPVGLDEDLPTVVFKRSVVRSQ